MHNEAINIEIAANKIKGDLYRFKSRVLFLTLERSRAYKGC